MANQKLDLTKFIPSVLRNETNTGLMENLFNRFLSDEQSIYVSGQVGEQADAALPMIAATDIDHAANALVPGIYLKQGTEEFVYTFDNLVSKLDSLGVDTTKLQSMLMEQSFNYVPPIDLDKFVNYSNYYWTAPALTPAPTIAWNPSLAAEYYVIARPPRTSVDKLPVRVATTRDIKLFAKDRPTEQITVTFTGPFAFNISSNIGPVCMTPTGDFSLTSASGSLLNADTFSVYAPALSNPLSGGYGIGAPDSTRNDLLFSFMLTQGTEPFVVGDSFTIEITHYVGTNTISFTPASGHTALNKGYISNITPNQSYMYIDGVRLETGDRVLVHSQTDKSKNGIYVVSGGKFARDSLSNQSADWMLGAKVYVSAGNSHAGKTFSVALLTQPFAIDSGDMIFVQSSSTAAPNVNDWQLYNYWAHKDDLTAAQIASSIQASAPIIEYSAGLQLNSHHNAGVPSDSGTLFSATKTRFNQIPLFDLYRYNGEHAGMVSGIFYFKEDPDFDVDPHLQRRTALTTGGDYIFGLSLEDKDGRLLFWKNAGALETVWQAGVTSPIVSTPVFTSSESANKGTLQISNIVATAENQSYTLTATSASNFVLTSLHNNDVSAIPVGTVTVVGEFSVLITAGSVPYTVGDKFTFNIHGLTTPRSVSQNSTGKLVNTAGGTWLTTRRMFENLKRELTTQISFGDMCDHFRSIIKAQNGLTGSAFGTNNYRSIGHNLGLGGTAHEFDSNFPLLVSNLIQRDMSPLSILDFGQSQYKLALSSIDRFILVDMPNWISTNGISAISTISPNDAGILALKAAFESIRAADVQLKTVFGDSTSGVTNWPISLAYMGCVAPVLPTITFNQELGIDVIVHHDGHLTGFSYVDFDTQKQLVATKVTRSDGTLSGGVFAGVAPMQPYAHQLWMNSQSYEVYQFNVDFDTSTAPTAVAGKLWFNRATGQLYEVDTHGNWTASAQNIASLWTRVDFTAIRTSLILAIEGALYAAAVQAGGLRHPMSGNSADLEIEFAKFAAVYKYDSYAPDYDVTNPFTWNYSTATIPGSTNHRARWFDVLSEYFGNFPGCLATSRPNLEPWKLLGYATASAFPGDFYGTYANAAVVDPTLAITGVSAVSTSNIPLSGLGTINGTTLLTGSRVLVTGQTNPIQNGLYVAKTGAWQRADGIQQGSSAVIEAGNYKGTTWVVMMASSIGFTPTIISPNKMWKTQLWTDIAAARPGIKLSVNPLTDSLLPPYVATSKPESAYAILTTIPSSIAASYSFGDNGPAEIVWKNSLEYSWGLARAAFKKDPMRFLDKVWGFDYITLANGLNIDRYTGQPLSHTNFMLHGAKTPVTVTRDIEKTLVGHITSYTDAVVKFQVARFIGSIPQFFMYINGDLIGSFQLGDTLNYANGSVSLQGLIVDDLGVPFTLGDTITINISVATSVTGSAGSTNADDCGCVIQAETGNQQTIYTPSYVITFTQASAVKQHGLGQIFTNLLRFNQLDASVSSAMSAFTGWDVKLVHRLDTLIRPETLKISTALGDLPSTAYSTIIKKSENLGSRWISAIRVQLVQVGQRVLVGDNYVPVADGADWVFRLEVYNPLHPVVDYYAVDTTGSPVTFKALSGQATNLEWNLYPVIKTKLTQTMPLVITGVQNVVNFLHGYVECLVDSGWLADESDRTQLDAETGRNLDWQLEIEKFVHKVYYGMTPGQGYILNPFMDSLWLSTPTGIMSTYSDRRFVDINTAQAVYDVVGQIIPVDDLTVERRDDKSATYSVVPMFSAHAFVDEYEHCIVFNNTLLDSQDGSSTLFNPALGQRISTAYMSYLQSDNYSKKPGFNGYILDGHNVKRNIVSSISAMSRYYDAGQTWNDPITAKHATALLGYSRKAYFDTISSSENTQFNFWRGMIQAKGTNASISAFANYKEFTGSSLDEYWAYKLAEYGDSRTKTSPELKISIADVQQQFSSFQFYETGTTPTALENFTLVESNDSSRWYSIDDVGTNMNWDATPVSIVVTADTTGYYKVGGNMWVGNRVRPTVNIDGATLINGSTLRVDQPGQYTITGYTWADQSKLSPIKLFDYKSDVLVANVASWHPAIGVHAYEPLASIDITSSTNPAFYNYSLQTSNNPNLYTLKPWGSKEVGRVWWNTSNLAYVPYADAMIFPDRNERHARWGSLAEWASIDLLEWVESTVHPSEYDALAAVQDGQQDIPGQRRASGSAAFKTTYMRTRTLSTRPIAWSTATTGTAGAHPAFGSFSRVKLYDGSGILYADYGRVADISLTAKSHLGGWKNNAPVGEVILGAELDYDIGTLNGIGGASISNSGHFVVTLSAITSGRLGDKIGSVYVQRHDGTDVSYIRMTNDAGENEDVLVKDVALSSASTLTFYFRTYGLKINVAAPAGNYLSTDFIDAIVAAVKDVFIREGIRYTQVIALPDTILVNDSTDIDALSHEYGWRSWVVPTAAQLAADLPYPNNKYQPYYGESTVITPSADILADINGTTLTLSDGTTVATYVTTWSAWSVVADKKVTRTSNGSTPISITSTVFGETTLDATRVSVYVNGIQVTPQSYTITAGTTSSTLTFNNVLTEGASVTVIYRQYTPTAAELAFDPAVAEDMSIMTQYKQDYEYTKVDVRNSSGVITSSLYYFWVSGRTVIAPNKAMAIKQAADALKSGPSEFFFYDEVNTATGGFDSITISGLNSLVAGNDQFKLRFIKDDTLRDDPQQLNLKNTHTEWTLLKRSQNSKIPRALWDLVTNAVCGQDVAGNVLPSPARVEYDSLNGTQSRYGFGKGQILVDTSTARATVTNTILNTALTITVGSKVYTDWITAINLDDYSNWFTTPAIARSTMEKIWTGAKAKQINEIFFDLLEDVLAVNYECTDIFKTSLVSVYASTSVAGAVNKDINTIF